MVETARFVEERRMFQVPDERLKRAGLQVCWTSSLLDFKFAGLEGPANLKP